MRILDSPKFQNSHQSIYIFSAIWRKKCFSSCVYFHFCDYWWDCSNIVGNGHVSFFLLPNIVLPMTFSVLGLFIIKSGKGICVELQRGPICLHCGKSKIWNHKAHGTGHMRQVTRGGGASSIRPKDLLLWALCQIYLYFPWQRWHKHALFFLHMLNVFLINIVLQHQYWSLQSIGFWCEREKCYLPWPVAYSVAEILIPKEISQSLADIFTHCKFCVIWEPSERRAQRNDIIVLFCDQSWIENIGYNLLLTDWGG